MRVSAQLLASITEPRGHPGQRRAPYCCSAFVQVSSAPDAPSGANEKAAGWQTGGVFVAKTKGASDHRRNLKGTPNVTTKFKGSQ